MRSAKLTPDWKQIPSSFEHVNFGANSMFHIALGKISYDDSDDSPIAFIVADK